jgi:putative SOS response-associated peptidase YedK
MVPRMCCRYHLSHEAYREILARLGLRGATDVPTRYNIAPGSAIPAVRTRGRPAQRETALLRWGLVPAWSERDEPATRLVNARAETLAAKPSFREAVRTRRCLVPAAGFYEWQTVGSAKQPWYFRRRDGQPFAFAGLWDTWTAPDGCAVESCAIITTAPNATMQPIHHRMPLVLGADALDAWLDPACAEPADLEPRLRPVADDALVAERVSPFVSNVRHEGPACLTPAADDDARESGPQLALGFE